MATVTLRTTMDMADDFYLPTSIYSIERSGFNGINGGEAHEFFIDDNDGDLGNDQGTRRSGCHVAALGTFYSSSSGRYGTIAEVQIETYDFGNFVDLDITGLSFTF